MCYTRSSNTVNIKFEKYIIQPGKCPDLCFLGTNKTSSKKVTMEYNRMHKTLSWHFYWQNQDFCASTQYFRVGRAVSAILSGGLWHVEMYHVLSAHASNLCCESISRLYKSLLVQESSHHCPIMYALPISYPYTVGSHQQHYSSGFTLYLSSICGV